MDLARPKPFKALAAGAGNPWLPATLVLPTFLLAFATLLLTCDDARVAPFWPANAAVVAMLLRSPPRRWWLGLAAGAAGLMFAALIDGDASPVPLLLLAGNVIEIAVCAGLVRLATREVFDLSRPSHLGIFLGAAAIVAPAVSATYAAIVLLAARGEAITAIWPAWYAGDALGLVLVTPVLLVAWRALARLYPA